MDELASRQTSSDLSDRLRATLATLELDCRCRSKLDEALDHFKEFEHRRQVRALIFDARNQAERIAALLELVSEIDTVRVDEADLGVFDEIAFLFADIGRAAACGAEDMRRTRSLAPGRTGSPGASGDRDGR